MVIKWCGLVIGSLGVGLLDYVTGYDVSVSVFYTIPVILAVWFFGRGGGIFMAVFSACVRLMAVIAMAHFHRGDWIPFWNTGVFLALLLLIVAGSDAMRKQLESARSKVKVLEGILHTCAGCNHVQDLDGHWTDLESYMTEHGLGKISRKVCPDCARKLRAETMGVGGMTQPAAPVLPPT